MDGPTGRGRTTYVAATVKVVDLQGVEWAVRRRWLPRYEGRGLRERLRQRRARSAAKRGDDKSHWYDALDFDFVGDSLSGVAITLVIVGAVILFILFGWPLLLALVDLVIVLVVAVIGVVGRLVFRRPWTVEACSATGERHEVRVVGWRRAGEMVHAMAREIEYGNPIDTGPATTLG